MSAVAFRVSGAGAEVYARAAFEMDLSGNSPKHKPKINFESAACCITGHGGAGISRNVRQGSGLPSSESRGPCERLHVRRYNYNANIPQQWKNEAFMTEMTRFYSKSSTRVGASVWLRVCGFPKMCC